MLLSAENYTTYFQCLTFQKGTLKQSKEKLDHLYHLVE